MLRYSEKRSFGRAFSSGRHSNKNTSSFWPTACRPLEPKHQHCRLQSVGSNKTIKSRSRKNKGIHVCLIYIIQVGCMLHGTFYSHVTSLTLTSRLAFRINVKGRGPPSSNKCKIWHGAGLSSTKTSEQNTQSTMQVTWVNPQQQRKYKTLLWDSLLMTLYDEFVTSSTF